MTLSGKVALVTGTSRGIGKAIALLLAQRGAMVIGTEIHQEGADAVTAMFNEAGLSGVGVVLNVNDKAASQATVDEIEKQHGAISILVNNAGITRDGLALRMKDEDWLAVIETNLTSVFTMSRAVLKSMMKARWGRIINITSVVGHSGNAGQINYGASKAGVLGLSKSLAREVASRGITVNCVAPGFIDTDMTRALSDEQRGLLTTQIPAGRLGTVDDVAQAVGFLSSSEAGYITGMTIHVNGGMYLP